MKIITYFTAIAAPFGALIGLVEIAVGVYTLDSGLQALGLVHFILNCFFGAIAFAFIRADI